MVERVLADLEEDGGNGAVEVGLGRTPVRSLADGGHGPGLAPQHAGGAPTGSVARWRFTGNSLVTVR